DGREALHLIQELQLTQRGAIGTPQPVLEYWLSDRHAPIAMPRQRRVLFFDPSTLRVESVQGHWFLRDAQQILFNFGPQAEDAQQALAMIQRYGFNEIGFIGRGTPAMMYFLADPNQQTGGERQPSGPSAPKSARVSNAAPPGLPS